MADIDIKDLPKYRCCICGKEFIGYGNNPWPVVKDENAKCCNGCNNAKVIAARIELMRGK